MEICSASPYRVDQERLGGDRIDIPPKRVVYFKLDKELKELIDDQPALLKAGKSLFVAEHCDARA